MSALVVDTSVWIDFFRGRPLPDLEGALRDGDVVLPPVVAAELLSARMAPSRRAQLKSFLADLPLHATPFEHWERLGALRATLARSGLIVSTPDAHVAQCALDLGASLWSHDAVFAEIARRVPLRLAGG